MNKYKIEISERFAKVVEVEAETENEAIDKVSELWTSQEIILGNDDFVDNYFEIVEVVEKKTNKYETICLLKTAAKIEDLNNVKKAFEDIVESVIEIDYMGVKKLAYKIGENECAFYIKAVIEGTTNDIVELERFYRKNDNVLKFITIKMED